MVYDYLESVAQNITSFCPYINVMNGFRAFLEGEYYDKMQKGRERERRIQAAMVKQCKLQVRPGTDAEDLVGIDCYITLNNKEYSVQIKYGDVYGRERFIYEVYSDLKTKSPGRDAKIQAQLYAVVIKGKLYIVKVADIKNAVGTIVKMSELQLGKGMSYIPVAYKGIEAFVKIEPTDIGKFSLRVIFPGDVLFADLLDPVFQCPLSI